MHQNHSQRSDEEEDTDELTSDARSQSPVAMAQNIPFIFGAGGGQPPPSLPSQQQQYPTQTPSNPQPQAALTMAQQAAFQQTAQLAGIDMSVLNGISPQQVAAIVQLFQAGALRPAPPELSAPAPAPSLLPPTVAQHETPEVQGPIYYAHTITQEQDIDVDKDEGEIEEIEPDNTMTERGFLHPPPTGPRNPNTNKRKPSPRPPIPTPPVDKRREPRPQQPPAPQVNGDANVATQESKAVAVKTFVLALHKEGYTFDQIAKEVGSPQALTYFYTQIGLEVPAQYSSNPKAQTNGNVTTKPPVKRPAPAKPAAPAKPQDRSEYLARLQAVKNKKAEPTKATTAAPKVDDNPKGVPKPEVQGTQDSSTKDNANKTNSKAVLKTALVRQRLEALRAQTAAKQNAALQPTAGVTMASPVSKPEMLASSNREATSRPSHAGLGAGLEEAATKATQMSSFAPPQPPSTSEHQMQGMQSTQPVISPPPPTPRRSMSGLPGLFMFDQSTQVQQPSASAPLQSPATPQQLSGPFSSHKTNLMAESPQALAEVPTAAPTGVNMPRKRPVASDFDYPASKPKRPFGLSRGNSADESVIITISDDEDDDADDEMDTDNALPPSRSKAPTSSFREAAPLPEFRQRPAFQTQVSGQSTPGRSSPGGVTLEQKNKEIEEMKRIIAEKEKRWKNATSKALSAQKPGMAASVTRSDAPSPAANGSSGSTPKVMDMPLISGGGVEGLVQSGSTGQPAETTSDLLASAASSARRQEKEQLKQKLRGLQQDEFNDINEAVEAAIDEAEPIEDLSANTLETVVEVESTPVVQETQAQTVAAENMNTVEIEEGEISDDSLFNFYSPDGAQSAPAAESAAEDGRKVGSQASTASESGDEEMHDTQPDVGLEVSQSLLNSPQSPMETPLPESIQQDADMGDTDQNTGIEVSQPMLELPESPIETQLSDSVPWNGDLADLVTDSMAPSQPMVQVEAQDEEEDSDSVSDDPESDDEDSQDLDQIPPNRQNNAAAEGLYQIEESSPADANAESEDYEPSSPIHMEATPEQESQGAEIAMPTAVSGASMIEPATKDDAPDDDLAPELQPPTEQQPEVATQVR